MTEIYGMLGRNQSGKSTVAYFIRRSRPGIVSVHLEFSGPIIDIINDWKPTWPPPEQIIMSDDEWLASFYNERMRPGLARAMGKYHCKAPSDKDLVISGDDIKQAGALFQYLRDCQSDRSLYLSLIKDEEEKHRQRQLLIWFGHYFRHRFGLNFWALEIGNRIDQMMTDTIDLITVSGVRFPSDAYAIKSRGGTLVKVIRFNFKSTIVDAAEIALHEISPDIVICNDGALSQLYKSIKLILQV